jgi:hypothetical protein
MLLDNSQHALFRAFVEGLSAANSWAFYGQLTADS